MCRKYHVRGEDITLVQVLDRLKNKSYIASRVVYSKQEIAGASRVLKRLAARTSNGAKLNGHDS